MSRIERRVDGYIPTVVRSEGAPLEAAELVSLRDLAIKINLCINDRTLRDWVTKGIISAPGKGNKGNLWQWIEQIIRHYQSRATADCDELRAAKIRTENARASKLELQVAEVEGELVRASEVVEAWTRTISLTKAKLLALASELAPELDGVTDTAYRKELIENAILDCLEELGSGGFSERIGSVESESDGVEAAAEADGE